jgi:hypothetical protein
MTTKNQPTESNPYAVRDHESTRLDQQDDVMSVACLFNTVGGELTTVDHHSIGSGPGGGKAQRLNKAVVENIGTPAAAPPILPPISEEQMPEQIPLPAAVHSPPQPVPEPAAPPQPPVERAEPVDLQPIITRVDALEDKLHIHFDQLEAKINTVIDIYGDILNKLTIESREIIIRTENRPSSEDTD